MKNLAVLAVLLGVIGCAYNGPTFDPLPYDQSEYDALPKQGSASVYGQLFAKTIGGDVKYGAGNVVYIGPDTAFFRQIFNEQLLQGKLASVDVDPRHIESAYTTLADAQGNYRVDGLPAGDYYIWSQVKWQAVESFGRTSYLSNQGGKVAAMITLADGEQRQLMLQR